MKAAASKKIKITLVRSLISRPESQRKVARGLGLGRLKSSVVREDTPSIRGMILKINHVVKVEGVE